MHLHPIVWPVVAVVAVVAIYYVWVKKLSLKPSEVKSSDSQP